MPDRGPPVVDAGERGTLLACLDYLRGCVVAKLAGLEDDDRARRPLVASGTSLHWLALHLTAVEIQQFQQVFAKHTRDWIVPPPPPAPRTTTWPAPSTATRPRVPRAGASSPAAATSAGGRPGAIVAASGRRCGGSWPTRSRRPPATLATSTSCGSRSTARPVARSPRRGASEAGRRSSPSAVRPVARVVARGEAAGWGVSAIPYLPLAPGLTWCFVPVMVDEIRLRAHARPLDEGEH